MALMDKPPASAELVAPAQDAASLLSAVFSVPLVEAVRWHTALLRAVHRVPENILYKVCIWVQLDIN